MTSITVFTPTYNRAYCLGKCYESLLRQTCKDFEWLIIDDGSTDNTAELIKRWQRETTVFIIRYYYKENGGMHTAYNLAYSLITSELSMNVDSDDFLTDTAIEDVLEFWKNNKGDEIGGIYALDMYSDGSVVGEKYPKDLKRFKGWGYRTVFYETDGKKKRYKNKGDKKFIGVTKVINQYPPIPEIPGERYYSLYYKQHYIERDYYIVILNKPVCVVEYLPDGSSNNMFTQYIKNPNGFRMHRCFVMKYAPTFSLRINAAIHYVAESLIVKDSSFISNSTNRLATILAIPAGLMLYALIVRKAKK